MSKKTMFIVAGSYSQAKEWVKNNAFKIGNCRPVYIPEGDTDMLMGIENPRVEYVGSWQLRDDICRIKNIVLAATR